MKRRIMGGLALVALAFAGCGELLGEDFTGYRLRCTDGRGRACGGDGEVAGRPSEGAGGESGGVAGAVSVSDEAGAPDARCGTAKPCLDRSMAAAGEAGLAGTGGAGGWSGAAGTGGSATACQPDAVVVAECVSTNGASFPEVALPAIQGIMMLSAEQYGGGFQAFASKRDSSLVAQLWSTTVEEPNWTPWLCFDSLPQPDRLAGHAMLDGHQEVFAVTLCGALYRRAQDPTGWPPWAPFSLPPAGQAVTDVAISETAEDTDIVYIADGGRIFARPRLGTERSAPYADWQEVPGASNASVVSGGLRSDQRQQVFMIDASGSVFTAIQSTKALGAPFGAWSDFDSSQLPAPLVDIEAPLGGPLPLEVFAVDSNGTLWQRAQDEATGTFEPWTTWDGPSAPGALLSLSGAGLKLAPDAPLRLAVLTETRHVYTVRRTAGVWGDWRLFP